MHDIFGKSFNIPFHPNLRPILLSVFVRYPEMLTPDAIAYLKKYGPVGCRDWQSVAVLRGARCPRLLLRVPDNHGRYTLPCTCRRSPRRHSASGLD